MSQMCKLQNNLYKTINEEALILKKYEQNARQVYVQVKLNGVTGYALIDTGCTTSLVSMKTAAKCGLKHRIDARYKEKLPTIEYEVETCGKIINSDPVFIITHQADFHNFYSYLCELEIGGTLLLLPIDVVDTKRSIIIGADVLRKMKAKISYPKNILMLQIYERSPYLSVPLVDRNIIKEQLKLKKKDSVSNRETEKMKADKETHSNRLNRSKRQREFVINHQYHYYRRAFDAHTDWISHFYIGRPIYIKILINGVQLKAMIDTGAQCSLLPQKVVEDCGIEHLIDPLLATYGSGVDGIKTKMNIIPKCELTLGDTAMVATFLVAKNTKLILIGQNILRELKAIINYEKGELQFRMNNKLIRQPITSDPLMTFKCLR